MKIVFPIDVLRRSATVALSVSCLVISGSPASPAGDFPWPIRSPRSISSTFGEPRPGRFHLGMDFKSGGVTGKKVIALGDGYIFRVKTSPFGYGKALYLKLDSGRIVVYGHLSEFLPEIEDILFSMRIQRKTYDIDWYPEPGRFRVKRGQVIAYSGDTGSGPAHLHLEIRDENNVPENPLDYGFDIRDTIPPVIESVVLIPLDGSSSVNGIPDAVRLDVPPPAGSPVVLTGEIGVAVSIFDRVNISNNRLGVYSLSLEVDSTMVFEKTYGKIPYHEDRFGGFDVISPKFNGGNGYLTVLFRREGNGLSIYRGDGVLSGKTLSDGVPRRRRPLGKDTLRRHSPHRDRQGGRPRGQRRRAVVRRAVLVPSLLHHMRIGEEPHDSYRGPLSRGRTRPRRTLERNIRKRLASRAGVAGRGKLL